MNLNEFFETCDVGRVEIFASKSHGDFRAFRVGNKVVTDNIYGSGPSPEAALSDLMLKVSAAARPKPAPVVIKQEPITDLDDLLG